MIANQIMHIELASSDPQMSAQFYAALFGWRVETLSPMDYTIARAADGHLTAAFVPVDGQDFQPSDALVYVSTDDIDATLHRAAALGGTIISPKFQVPTVGWLGVVGDPGGNKVAVMQPAHC